MCFHSLSLILLNLYGEALAVVSPLTKTAWESSFHPVLHLYDIYNGKKHN